jgi:hypothetical protein
VAAKHQRSAIIRQKVFDQTLPGTCSNLSCTA